MQHLKTTISETANKINITVPKKGSVKTMDAATDEALDITSLFSIGAKNSFDIRPSDKTVERVLMSRSTPRSALRLVAIVPEPTTTATRVQVPRNSAIALRSIEYCYYS